jgi:hypothetical protein
VALHLLQEVVGTPVEDRTVSNAKRADLATVPGYVPTQYPTQLGLQITVTKRPINALIKTTLFLVITL